MSCVEVVPLKDEKSVLKYLDPTSGRWGNGSRLDWVFRGVGESEFLLLPSAWRDPTPEQLSSIMRRDVRHIDAELEKLTRWDGDWTQHINAFKAVYSELTAIWEFIQFADELGLDPPVFNEASKRLALTEATTAFHHDVGINWTDTAAAQHFGIPTRLLDWSLDPLVALYFAASDSQAIARSDSSFLAVWALQKSDFEDIESGDDFPLKLVYPFRESNGFLRAQRGAFTLISKAETFFRDHGRWPSVDDALATVAANTRKHKLQKILIPKSISESLLRLLWRRGISRAHLMPTLENAAAAMKDRWRYEAADAIWAMSESKN